MSVVSSFAAASGSLVLPVVGRPVAGGFPSFGFSCGGVPCLLFLLLLLRLVLCVPFLLLLFGCCRSCGLVPVLPLLALPSVPMVGLVSSGLLVLRLLRLVRCAVRCFLLVTLALWFASWRLVLTRLMSGSAVSFEAADSPASGLPFGSPVSVTVGLLPVGGVCEFLVYSLFDCWNLLLCRNWFTLACDRFLES